ncbi:MAG: hypothetical protein AAF196_08930 [Planctomycetota bacterium]
MPTDEMANLLERFGYPGAMLLVFGWLGKRFVDGTLKMLEALVKSMQDMRRASETHEDRSSERHQELVEETKEVARAVGRLCTDRRAD